jgi:hypothetical protein
MRAKADTKRQQDNKRRLDKETKRIDRRVDLAVIELGQTLKNIPQLAGFFADLEHLHHDRRDLVRIFIKSLRHRATRFTASTPL